MKNLLTIQNLNVSIHHDDEWITPIHDVNFTIGYQQTVGLVGESGSGKSLTARAILKLLSRRSTKIQAGKMQLGNIDLLAAGKKLMQKVLGSQVGFVMQDCQGCLNPTMKIADQITESILAHKIVSSKQAAITEAKRLLDLVEINNSLSVLNSYPFELSGGMKQRIAIATAVATKPKLLIADEPTSALDMESQEATLELIQTIQNEFLMSVLLITHDLNLAKNFCDKIVVMYAGRTIETLEKQDYLFPFHPYTKHLLHSKPTIHTPKHQPLFCLEKDLNITDSKRGCPFASRCPQAMNICSKFIPEEIEMQTNHHVSCFLCMNRTLEEVTC